MYEKVLESKRVSILSEPLLQAMGAQDYLCCEEEVLVSDKYANQLYFECFDNINKGCIWTDLGVILNGEVHTFWNRKLESMNSEDPFKEKKVNELSIRLHRKASPAWHYRRLLFSQYDFNLTEELEFLKEIADLQKQNYYLWEYKRWLWTQLDSELQLKDFKSHLKYCSSHISDSSSFHFLFFVCKELGKFLECYEWICKLCQTYYGPKGLYTEKAPAGYETLHLFRSKVRSPNQVPNEIGYLREQTSLGRSPQIYFNF